MRDAKKIISHNSLSLALNLFNLKWDQINFSHTKMLLIASTKTNPEAFLKNILYKNLKFSRKNINRFH
jgi:hypothetical protein